MATYKVQMRSPLLFGLGEGKAGISPAEQCILVRAILCVFVSFVGGDVKLLQKAHFFDEMAFLSFCNGY